jgi:hypothetical protein
MNKYILVIFGVLYVSFQLHADDFFKDKYVFDGIYKLDNGIIFQCYEIDENIFNWYFLKFGRSPELIQIEGMKGYIKSIEYIRNNDVLINFRTDSNIFQLKYNLVDKSYNEVHLPSVVIYNKRISISNDKYFVSMFRGDLGPEDMYISQAIFPDLPNSMFPESLYEVGNIVNVGEYQAKNNSGIAMFILEDHISFKEGLTEIRFFNMNTLEFTDNILILNNSSIIAEDSNFISKSVFYIHFHDEENSILKFYNLEYDVLYELNLDAKYGNLIVDYIGENILAFNDDRHKNFVPNSKILTLPSDLIELINSWGE